MEPATTETPGGCAWAGRDPAYRAYHDREWGVPQRDSRALWGNLVLESFQSGLSWLTILRKRENFRAAFAGLDPAVVAGWGAPEVARLMADAGIVRHRGKIEATLANARAWVQIEEKTGFSAHVWRFVDGAPIVNHWRTRDQLPARTALSDRLARDLKARGFRFCGPTTVYAFMQASGLVNDHLVSCPRHAAITQGGAGG